MKPGPTAKALDWVAAASLLMLAPACTRGPRIANPQLVQPYSPAAEASLFGHEQPVLAIFTTGNRKLAFLGAIHSSDPESATFRKITQAFREVRPKIVILEGFPTSWGSNPRRVMRSLDEPSLDSSYDVAEDMFAARLARENGAAVIGAEPDEKQLAAALRAQGFLSRDIFVASMFGPLAQDLEAGLFTGPSDPRFQPAYEKWVRVNAPVYDPSAPTNAAAFGQWYERQFGRALDQDPHWSTRGGPGQPGLAGRINRASNILRDQHMFALAVKATDQGPVLLVAGRSHLSNQWRALKHAFGRVHLP